MALRLLHPVMPFLTEELWQRLATGVADRPESISIANYPQYNAEAMADSQAEHEISVAAGDDHGGARVEVGLKMDRKTILDGTLVLRPKAVSIGAE